MYAQAIAIASLATAVLAAPQSAPPAYGASSSPVSPISSSVAPPAYSSTPVSSSAVVYSGSASASVSSAPVPSGSAYPSCWAECFSENQVSSEAELCGNTAVDACIQQECTAAEDQAYWAWYESYCPATSTTTGYTSSPATYATTSTSTSPVIPTSSAPSCWTQCFAENDVTSEAELCGDDAVSQCIYETCDSGDDQAYWAWYEGYCTGAATVTTVVTLTSPCAYTSGTDVVTTGWESTAWTPAGAPTSGAAPYPSGGSGSWGSTASAVAGATGTGSGSWPAASSGWPVVPATGGASSTVAKSGFALLAGFLGLVALL